MTLEYSVRDSVYRYVCSVFIVARDSASSAVNGTVFDHVDDSVYWAIWNPSCVYVREFMTEKIKSYDT